MSKHKEKLSVSEMRAELVLPLWKKCNLAFASAVKILQSLECPVRMIYISTLGKHVAED